MTLRCDFIWHWFLYAIAAQKLNQKNHRFEYYGYFHISISRFLKVTFFGRVAPIVQEGVTKAEAYINPVQSGLVLTGW